MSRLDLVDILVIASVALVVIHLLDTYWPWR